MDELFFGKKRTRRSPRRTRRSPKRSPRRMCRKGLSLSKLRKLAVENGVNIFSEAPTRVSKRTGERLKPKMVGCGTLMNRLKEAGLDSLYRVRSVPMVDVDMDEDLFLEEPMGPLPMTGPCTMNQVYRGGSCVDIESLLEDQCTGDDLMWNKLDKPPKCVRKPKAPTVPLVPPPLSVKSLPRSVLMQADPACDSAFQALAQKQPNNRAQAKFLKQYKGYAMGQGPCDKRELVPVHMHGDESDVDDYAKEAGFDMSYGRRYMGGARPKKSQKHVGEIVVKGRTHQVFKGVDGGLYYMKGSRGDKIYIDKKRLKKKSPKRRRNRFGEEEDDEEMEYGMDFGKRHKAVARINVAGRLKLLYRGSKGGFYYLKNRNKVYVKPESAKKRRSPLRR